MRLGRHAWGRGTGIATVLATFAPSVSTASPSKAIGLEHTQLSGKHCPAAGRTPPKELGYVRLSRPPLRSFATPQEVATPACTTATERHTTEHDGWLVVAPRASPPVVLQRSQRWGRGGHANVVVVERHRWSYHRQPPRRDRHPVAAAAHRTARLPNVKPASACLATTPLRRCWPSTVCASPKR